MAAIFRVPLTEWPSGTVAADARRGVIDAVERGEVLFFPHLSYAVDQIDRLRGADAEGTSKNISFDSATGRLGGAKLPRDLHSQLTRAMSRYCSMTLSLVLALLPGYQDDILTGRTSFRPAQIAGRRTSWRKDDSRLHVDSFPSNPVQGKRILRVFSNVNPDGEPRSWRTGEPFEDIAKKFLPGLQRPPPVVSFALACLGITKSRRSAYDHLMLKLHDAMKSDDAFQASAEASAFDFPAGTTWMMYSDMVAHAAMSGSCAFEQTFYIPVACMEDPARSPLAILERLSGRQLV
jgi:hypothetical protein